ncbi:MAG: anti-sigma factor [Pirellulales bacterium]
MQCDEFENRLNDLLDARAAPEQDPQLAAHGEECQPCRALLAAERRLLQGLARNTLPTVAADFADVVVRRSRVPVRPWRKYAAWAVAASLLMAVGIRWMTTGQIAGPTPTTIAKDTPGGTSPDAIGQQLPPLPGRTTPSRYLAAAQETRQTFSEALLIFPTTPSVATSSTVAGPADDEPGEEAVSWPADVAECMEPLADTTGDALDFLLSVLPADAEAAQPAAETLPPPDGV